jgi:3-deoxy-D-manno-octulosonic-acid transferase
MWLFENIFFILYRFVFWPSVIGGVLIVKRWTQKLNKAYDLRRSHRDMPNFAKRPVWIHASSGEFEYAKPVIRKSKEHDPNQPIVVTYFSPSYASAIANTPDIAWSAPLPLDLPGPVHSFLQRLNPCALLVARTDLWPELLRQTQARKIPSLLFSATVRAQLTSANLFTRLYRRWLYRHIGDIYAVAATDESALHALGAVNAKAMGDTRFDQVFYRLQHPKRDQLGVKTKRCSCRR